MRKRHRSFRRALRSPVKVQAGRHPPRSCACGPIAYGLGIVDSEIFDPATDRWASTAPSQFRHSEHAAVPLDDGRIWIVGGGQPTCDPNLDESCGTYHVAELVDGAGPLAVRVSVAAPRA